MMTRFSAHRPFLACTIFLAAYFTTITVNAQSPVAAPTNDAIQLNSMDNASITGTILEAEDNYVIVDSAGKQIKVVLSDVNMQGEADTVFKPGMAVTVHGSMSGDDFGTPLFTASSIRATETPASSAPESTAPVTMLP